MTTISGRHRRDGPPGLRHVALLHAGDSEFVDAAVSHAEAGFESGEPVVAALSPKHLELLHAALGPDADRVDFRDMSEIGRNPGRLIPALHAVLDEYRGRGRIHILGGSVWSGRSAGELGAAVQNEALLNLAAPDAPVSLLCPYDVTQLDRGTLDLAVAAHPELQQVERTGPSPTYDPLAAANAAVGPMDEPDPRGEGEALVYAAPHGPRNVREAVAAHAIRAGLDEKRTTDLCHAVHELAVNTVMHTGARGILSLWVSEGHITCEIQDSGWIQDPLAGRYPAGPGDARGYGLRLVHEVCDLVLVRSGSDGTTIRVSMQLV